MTTVELTARGPYSLAASIRFLEGFAPAAYDGRSEQTLDLAFPVDTTWQTVGARVRAHRDGVTAEIVGPGGLEPMVTAQLARILSLDVDGSGFAAVGARDAVVGGLQRRYPGLRPVCFWSPYEAAAWTIIGQRIRITQAAAIKARMSAELGESIRLGDREIAAFPAPRRLARLDAFPGLSGRKPEWLRSIARAALDGRLDAATLRALPYDDAVAALRELPGIGPFAAELIMVRGVGVPDHLPLNESRLPRAIALAYDLPEPPTGARMTELGRTWAPYRSWVSVLLRVNLEEVTHEIAGARSSSTR